MDAAELIRQAQSSVDQARHISSLIETSDKNDDSSPRIAYTLTACCRCRQARNFRCPIGRKTRCDPNLPRCLPCERGGLVCEYFDRKKNKRIPRSYVLRLQENIRALESKLREYTENETQSTNTEDIVRPGGFVRLNSDDETPRFLGPSSGITMTRLVMEEAKKYTDSRTIRELVPGIRDRQSFPSACSPGRKKSYPLISALAAQTLPSLLVTEKLVEIAQYFTPTLHEPSLKKDMREVHNGSTDAYKNFVIRMVLAISLQKLDLSYAGLADSYYLSAMEYMEEVVRQKDLKTLQCLVLVAQYSLLTPTQTPIYFIVGLATRLCQQLGLNEEKTVGQGVAFSQIDPIQLDMRRRLSWIILSMEFGLAHSMGRPNAFACGQNKIDVRFFEPRDDEYITSDGILPGPISEKKTVAIHFMRMRLLQAEIRRVLYQSKRPEPQNEDHQWFKSIQQKMKEWVDASPQSPSWSKQWFFGRYQTMILMLFRPSPQVPQPMPRSAIMCYNAASFNVKSLNKQIKTAMVDITWIFVLTLYQALNILLWTTSYPEIRALHSKEELEEDIQIAIEAILMCRERWPGTDSTAQLYAKIGEACLRSYDHQETSNSPPAYFHDDKSQSSSSPISVNEIRSPKVLDHPYNLAVPQPLSANNLGPSNMNDNCFDQNLDFKVPNGNDNKLITNQPSNYPDPKFEPPHKHVDSLLEYPTLNKMQPHYFTDANFMITKPHSLEHEFQRAALFDSNYSLHATPHSLGNSMNVDPDFDIRMKMESLSHQQQIELMQNLEMNGLNEINNLINPCSRFNELVKTS
ncbi:fungal specific transcription factor domain-containing protein [Blumeria hordei DH14]|uniref:Fungal specific transcription factor domain-containing protein n=1 Tax=Blumeria graminis f. sp. hordei (strain DH14) TaxID=546991 RepID=N1JM17_BLUG1|nr:fungal specific transcription factor domain-containing protein [Blumeria hordei DH14]